MRRLLMLWLHGFFVVLPSLNGRGKEACGEGGKNGGRKAHRRLPDALGRISRGAGEPGVFAELQPSLSTLVGRLDDAAADKNVLAVWLKIEDVALGHGKIHELRGAVARLRKANKPVYAELTTAEHRSLSAGRGLRQDRHAAQRHVDRSRRAGGDHFLQGTAGQVGPASSTACRWASTKAPPNRSRRNEMSKPLRESFDALVDDIYDGHAGHDRARTAT